MTLNENKLRKIIRESIQIALIESDKEKEDIYQRTLSKVKKIKSEYSNNLGLLYGDLKDKEEDLEDPISLNDPDQYKEVEEDIKLFEEKIENSLKSFLLFLQTVMSESKDEIHEYLSNWLDKTIKLIKVDNIYEVMSHLNDTLGSNDNLINSIEENRNGGFYI